MPAPEISDLKNVFDWLSGREAGNLLFESEEIDEEILTSGERNAALKASVLGISRCLHPQCAKRLGFSNDPAAYLDLCPSSLRFIGLKEESVERCRRVFYGIFEKLDAQINAGPLFVCSCCSWMFPRDIVSRCAHPELPPKRNVP